MLVSTIGNDVIAKSPIIRKPKNGFAPTTSSDKIKIYTLEGCPACIDAKKLIAKKGLSSTEVTVTDENQNEIFSKIDAETNKQRGFPIIFINEKYIGGLDSLEKRLK
jgi:glutaredoxin